MYKILSRYFFTLLITIYATFATSEAYTENNTSAIDYNKLCHIYEEIIIQKIDLGSKEMEITNAVQNNFPAFFNSTYSQILWADPDKRYSFIKQLAEGHYKKPWSCDKMKSYYENEFK
ncbi:MAG TPA: hypothetical protein VIQ03_14120 [Gammaproteobacteria bacterium]